MILRSILRLIITVTVTGLAIWLGYILWQRYMIAPWTRDGVVQAHIVNVAADVSGRVVVVAVHDNETVKQGQVLFLVDPKRYLLAVHRAEARLAEARANLALRREQANRRADLGPDIVSAERNDDAALAVRIAEAAYAQDRAALALALLNFKRTRVLAPAAGVVTNLRLRKGDFVNTGIPRIALVVSRTFWVYGYFEQTRLAHVHVGDPVEISLLGQHPVITGQVQSISSAISDRESTEGGQLIANVRPTFNWVRLAARIPVRIKLIHIPRHTIIAAGMICTVVVEPHKK